MKVEKIKQIVALKRVVQRWRDRSSNRHHRFEDSSCRRVEAGFLAVYVGPERRRFVIPTRFLKLGVVVGLLNKAEEELGFPAHGGLVLPCDPSFFAEVLRLLDRDERRFGRLGLDEFVNLVTDLDFDFDSCKESVGHAFTPLLRQPSY